MDSVRKCFASCRFPALTFVIGFGLFGIVSEAVLLSQYVESHGNVVERLHRPLFAVALAGGTQCLLVVLERQTIIAHIVVNITQHGIQVPRKGGLIQVAGQLFRPLYCLHRLMRLLLLVQDDAMMEQGSGLVLSITVMLIIVSAYAYERV